MTYVRSDEKQADAVERVLDRLDAYPFEIELLLAEQGARSEIGAMDTEATVIVVPEPGAVGQEADYP